MLLPEALTYDASLLPLGLASRDATIPCMRNYFLMAM